MQSSEVKNEKDSFNYWFSVADFLFLRGCIATREIQVPKTARHTSFKSAANRATFAGCTNAKSITKNEGATCGGSFQKKARVDARFERVGSC